MMVMTILTYAVAWMKQSGSLYDALHASTAGVHQGHVVSVEVVAVRCWVKRNVNGCVDERGYHRHARYPTSDTTIVRTLI